MSSKGWIKVHRQLQDCYLWNDKPFNQGAAWVDLLLLANHKDTTIIFDKKPMLVSAGCLITSSVKLSERWGWSRGKVNRFLNALRDEHMIELDVNAKRTAITIVNYSVFQDTQTTDGQVTDNRRTTDGQLTDTNKNDKNVKNVKNKYGTYQKVLLTEAEYTKLGEDYGTDKRDEAIRFLDEYIAEKGYKSKSHNLAMRRWVFQAVEEKKPKKKQNVFNDFKQNTYDFEELEKRMFINA